MPDTPTVSVEELIERIRSGSYPPWYLINAAASHLRSLVEENKRAERVRLDLKQMCQDNGFPDVGDTHGLDYTLLLGKAIERLKARLDAAEAVVIAANNLVNCPAWDRGNCAVDPEIEAAVDVLDAALIGVADTLPS